MIRRLEIRTIFFSHIQKKITAPASKVLRPYLFILIGHLIFRCLSLCVCGEGGGVS